MRAEAALPVAAEHVGAGCRPERSRLCEVAAEGVPAQAGVFGAQGREPGAGQPTALVAPFGVGLLDPSQSAAAARLVVDGEHRLVVEVGGTLAPAGPLRRGRVPPAE